MLNVYFLSWNDLHDQVDDWQDNWQDNDYDTNPILYEDANLVIRSGTATLTPVGT